MTSKDYWFTPKTHGYGAAPANWKGWAAVLGYVAIVMAITVPLMVLPAIGQTGPTREYVSLWLVLLIVLTIGFSWLCLKKTDGDWRWRWGEKE